MKKVWPEKSRTWNECNIEESNIKEWNIEKYIMKKSEILKKQPGICGIQEKWNMKKVWYEKSATWKEWTLNNKLSIGWTRPDV